MVIGVSSFVNGGIKDDDRKLSDYGIDKLSAEALPYYLRWIRQDIIRYLLHDERRLDTPGPYCHPALDDRPPIISFEIGCTIACRGARGSGAFPISALHSPERAEVG